MRILAILAALWVVTQTAPCPYEENCHCQVPGITVRWKAAYCMALNQTDDLENQSVSACIAATEPRSLRGRTACAQNLHWKTEVCRTLAKGDRRQAAACVADREMIPAIVRRGAESIRF